MGRGPPVLSTMRGTQPRAGPAHPPPMEPSAWSLPREHPPSTSRQQLHKYHESPSGCHKQQKRAKKKKKSGHVPTELQWFSHPPACGHLREVEGVTWESQPAGAQGMGTCWLFISSFPQTIDTSSTQSSLTTTSLRPPDSQPPNDHHCQTDKGGASFSRGLPKTTGAERSAQTELSHPRLYSTPAASQIERKRVLVISSQKTKTDRRELGACSLSLCQGCAFVCVVHIALWIYSHQLPKLAQGSRVSSWASPFHEPVHSFLVVNLYWTWVGLCHL